MNSGDDMGEEPPRGLRRRPTAWWGRVAVVELIAIILFAVDRWISTSNAYAVVDDAMSLPYFMMLFLKPLVPILAVGILVWVIMTIVDVARRHYGTDYNCWPELFRRTLRRRALIILSVCEFAFLAYWLGAFLLVIFILAGLGLG